jgi:hypothetical protein
MRCAIRVAVQYEVCHPKWGVLSKMRCALHVLSGWRNPNEVCFCMCYPDWRRPRLCALHVLSGMEESILVGRMQPRESLMVGCSPENPWWSDAAQHFSLCYVKLSQFNILLCVMWKLSQSNILLCGMWKLSQSSILLCGMCKLSQSSILLCGMWKLSQSNILVWVKWKLSQSMVTDTWILDSLNIVHGNMDTWKPEHSTCYMDTWQSKHSTWKHGYLKAWT